MTTREENLVQLYNNQFLGTLHNAIMNLRRVADQIQRLVIAYDEDPNIDILSGEHEAVITARRVLHEVLWMVPNLHLDSLPEMAARIDRAYRAIVCPTCGAPSITFIDGDCPKCNPPVKAEPQK